MAYGDYYGGAGGVSVYTPGYSVTPLNSYGDPNAMYQLSVSMVYAAEQYLGQLGASAASLVPPTINPSFPVISAAPAQAIAPLPTMQAVTWTPPQSPGAFSGTLNTDGLLPGPFQGLAPTLNFGTPPAAFSGQLPAAPAVNLNFQYPTPSIQLPSIPSLLSLDTILLPSVSIPTFTASVPTLSAGAPTIRNYTEGPLYASDLLSQVEDNLTRALADGSWTGLPAAAEGGLWDRGSDREFRAQADALADLDRMESLGYAFPPGVWLDARIKIQTETDNTRTALSREIMVKQAELTLENITKARSEAVQLEGKLIDYTNQVAQRTFDSCKYVTEAGVQIYNAAVEGFKASLEGYRTQATVYEAQIRGLEATVKVYQAEIEFERTKAEINTALINQYKTEVDAAMATLKITELQVEIIKTQAEVEKIKVEVFGSEVQAFASTVNAYTAQVGAYKTQVEAQGAIEGVYKTQAEVYGTLVQSGTAAINAKVADYKGRIEAYTAQIELYKSQIQSMIGQAQAANFYNTSQAEVYRAEVASLQSYNEVLTKQWEAAVSEGTNIAQVAVKAAEANGQLYISSRSLALDASKVGAQVCAQLGAASLNAIHWSSSVSSSQSESNSNSNSYSQSQSNSYSQSNSNSNSNVNQTTNSNVSQTTTESITSTATNTNTNTNTNTDTVSATNSNTNTNTNTDVVQATNTNTNTNTNIDTVTNSTTSNITEQIDQNILSN